MNDTELTCQDCQTTFMFTEKEQAFYEEKGFTPPKRCKPCRDAKKARQQGGAAQGGRPQRDDRSRPSDRPMFDVTCSECGANAQVPFEPRQGAPVYCRDCFKVKSVTRGPRR